MDDRCRDISKITIEGIGRLEFRLQQKADMWISDQIRRGSIHDSHIVAFLKSCLAPGAVFVDVGANLGWFTVIASRLVGPNGRVISIEPDPINFALLRENVERNQCANVDVVMAAAGEKNTSALLFRSPDNQGDHRLATSSDRLDRVEVSVVPLDELISKLVDRVDMVKIDTQGSETAVLRGMKDTLRSNPTARVVFEFWPYGLAECGSSARELVDVLKSWPTNLWLLHENGVARKVDPEIIERLSVYRYSPLSQRQIDVVAVNMSDKEANDYLQKNAKREIYKVSLSGRQFIAYRTTDFALRAATGRSGEASWVWLQIGRLAFQTRRWGAEL